MPNIIPKITISNEFQKNTKATNIAGGGTYQVVYQTSTDSTAFVTNGTTGQVLTANSSGAPSWQTPSGGVTQAKATAISLIFGL